MGFNSAFKEFIQSYALAWTRFGSRQWLKLAPSEKRPASCPEYSRGCCFDSRSPGEWGWPFTSI